MDQTDDKEQMREYAISDKALEILNEMVETGQYKIGGAVYQTTDVVSYIYDDEEKGAQLESLIVSTVKYHGKMMGNIDKFAWKLAVINGMVHDQLETYCRAIAEDEINKLEREADESKADDREMNK